MEWEACAALRYPRTLPRLIAPDDARHLADFYYGSARWRTNESVYYHLLEAGLAGRLGGGALSALRRIKARVAEAFGPQFVLMSDFFSHRSPAVGRVFPDWHQDYAFWLTGGRCTGFNLWILLDQRGMNRSFDIYEVSRARALYREVYRRANASAAACAARRGRLPHGGRRVCSLPGAGTYLNRHGRGDTLLGSQAISNVPLRVGDALVLRQVEIHRTDARIREGQWRLALGFKVLERAPLVKEPGRSKVGKRLQQLRAQWPTLAPAQAGLAFPDYYRTCWADWARPSSCNPRG